MVRTRLVCPMHLGSHGLNADLLGGRWKLGGGQQDVLFAANLAACVNREFSINVPLYCSTNRSMSAGETRYFFWYGP